MTGPANFALAPSFALAQGPAIPFGAAVPLSSTPAIDRAGQAASTPGLPRTDHVFVNNVRFLAMAVVVLGHCISLYGRMAGPAPSDWAVCIIQQPFRFGAIGFFLISGYLVSEGLTRRRPVDYVKRRMKTVLGPWAIWLMIFFFVYFPVNEYHRLPQVHSLLGKILTVLGWIKGDIFNTPFWFVPNMLVALTFLLLCRRFLYDLRLGLLFMSFSVFYGLNIYTHWIPGASRHTEAVLGFVFYMWLGAWAAKNTDKFQAWLARTPMWALFLAAAVTFTAALFEAHYILLHIKSDAENSLRISNQIYSIIVVLMIAKLRHNLWPAWFQVRTSTFGIYLVNRIVLAQIFTLARHAQSLVDRLPTATPLENLITSAFLSLLGFAITYGVSLGITLVILRIPRLRWIVGRFDDARRSVPQTAPAG